MTNIIGNEKDLKIFLKRFLFYDGLMDDLNINYRTGRAALSIVCRDQEDKWGVLSLYLEGTSLIRIHDTNCAWNVLFHTLRIFPCGDSFLVTLDDESVTEPDTLKTEGNFVFVAGKISYSFEYQ